jgi:hypothetical protein
MKRIALFAVMLLLTAKGMAQKDWKELFDKKYSEICASAETMREISLKRSASGDSYDFMVISNILDALQCMYLSTGEKIYLNDLIMIIDNILSTAQVSKEIPGNIYPHKDNYLSWTSKNRFSDYNNEAVLYEGYIFRYITLLMYHLHQSGWANLSAENQSWYNQTLHFIEKNVWEKWITRSNRTNGRPYTIFLRSRTHMGAHNAMIAFFLKEITTDPVIKTQCTELYNMYDLLLKRNFKSNPAIPQAYIWNSTWDDVSGTQALPVNSTAIQDVAHGNHVLSYVTTSKKFGNTNWSDKEIDSLCNTVRLVIFNKAEFSFFNVVDGTYSPDILRHRGNYQAEGWIKLSWFNQETWDFYINFAFRGEQIIRLEQDMELQYYANLLYTAYLRK